MAKPEGFIPAEVLAQPLARATQLWHEGRLPTDPTTAATRAGSLPRAGRGKRR